MPFPKGKPQGRKIAGAAMQTARFLVYFISQYKTVGRKTYGDPHSGGGRVVGEPGLRHLERHLRPLQKLKDIAFTVVNGENASGVGLTPDQARRIYDAGADVVTLGNHTFGKMQIRDFLEDVPWLLRPANYTAGRRAGAAAFLRGTGSPSGSST